MEFNGFSYSCKCVAKGTPFLHRFLIHVYKDIIYFLSNNNKFQLFCFILFFFPFTWKSDKDKNLNENNNFFLLASVLLLVLSSMKQKNNYRRRQNLLNEKKKKKFKSAQFKGKWGKFLKTPVTEMKKKNI